MIQLQSTRGTDIRMFDYEIVKADNMEHLRLVSICFQSSFPDSFASKLGIPYLVRMHEWFLEEPDGFILFIRHEKQCVGFVSGYVGTSSASAMMQFALWAAFRSLALRPWLVFEPEVRKRRHFITRNLKKRFFVTRRVEEREKEQNAYSFSDSVGLVGIGVHREYQGKGLGSIMLRAFDQEVMLKRLSHAHLSVKRENKRAIHAYRKHGWKVLTDKAVGITMVKEYECHEEDP